MKYIKQIITKNKGSILFYLLTGILISFLTNYKADYLQNVINGLSDHTLTLKEIFFYGGILISFYLVNYLDEYPAKKLSNGIFLDFKILSLKKISKIEYLEYQMLGTGKLTQRIEAGAEAGKNIIYDYFLCLIRQLIPTIAFSVFFIWKINKKITIVIVLGYVVVFLVTNLLLRILYQLKEKILSNQEKMNHFLVRGFMEMVVFRLENRFSSEIKKAVTARNEIVNAKVKMNMIHEAFFTIFALLVGFMDVGVLVYAWSSKEVSVGSAVALITLLDNAYTPIAIFNVLYVQYKLDKAAYKRFEEFLDLKEDSQLDCGLKKNNCKGEISIKNLDFYYGERKIFSDLNLSIKAGEKVAFVGGSGSGKSTLVKLILGLLKYSKGSVKIDGDEVSEYFLPALYESICYVSQDTPVFDGSVRENIVFDGTYDDDMVMAALQKVQLLEQVKKMENGLESPIGERGAVLSGGEKQRLVLARLWFHKQDVVFLDEATSAMDNLTEEAVMQEVVRQLDGKTVIAIAHRLSSIKEFDRIVVFKEGEIICQGTFCELIKESEYFRELYNTK